MTNPTSESAKPTALQIVHEQAEDEGLWFEAQTAPEAYLQQELRRLHAALEAPQDAKPVTHPVCPWCGQFNWQEDQFNHYDAPHKAYSIICDTRLCGYQTATFKTIAEAWASIAPTPPQDAKPDALVSAIHGWLGWIANRARPWTKEDEDSLADLLQRVEEALAALPAQTADALSLKQDGFYAAAMWLRNHYQDYPNIADLASAMECAGDAAIAAIQREREGK
jgi:hypothetical protein